MDKEKKTKASEILKELINKSFDIKLLKNPEYRDSLERAIEILTEEDSKYVGVPFKTKGEVVLDLKYGDASYSYYDYWYFLKVDKTGKSAIYTEDFEEFNLYLTKEIEEFFIELGILKDSNSDKLNKEEAIALLKIEQDFLTQQESYLKNSKENFINMYKKYKYD